MENLSDYIPILILIAYALFTVLGRKKKASDVTHETTTSGQTAGEFVDESSFPKSFLDLLQSHVEEKPKKPATRKPEIKQLKKEIAPVSPTPVFIEPDEDEISPFSLGEEDDVRRAIIYSEIMNRKEY